MTAKIVMVTGISGSGSKEFCRRYADEYNAKGVKTKVYNTGDMLFGLVQRKGEPRIAKQNLLRMRERGIEDTIGRVFDVITDNLPADMQNYDRILIDTHAQFFWNNVLTNAYSWDFLNRIPIDLFATVIDKPSSIKERQMQTPQGKTQTHGYNELLFWQNVETNTTKGWAENYGKPMYIFSSKQYAQDLESLLFNELLIYPSFSMTDATPEDTAKIAEFKQFLRESRKEIDGMLVPINDPADIDIETDPALPANVRAAIDAQTVRRDYQYIWQSIGMVAFYPSEKTPLSKGSDDELKEAKDSGKFAFLVSPRKRLSPFYKEYNGIFRDLNDFRPFWMQFLREQLEFYRRK